MTVVNVVLGPAAEIIPAASLPSRINASAVAVSTASASAAFATAAVAETTSVSSPAPLFRLIRGAVLCNDATFEAAPTSSAPHTPPALLPPPRIVGGNGTDKALLAWALSLGGAEERHGWLAVLRVPFSSATKEALTVQSSTTSGAAIVFLKGAPDMLLPRCSAVYDEGGAAVPLDAPALDAYDEVLEALGHKGQRIIALCERPLPRAEFPPGYDFDAEGPEPNFPIDDLILVGLVAVTDPPRASTAAAVRELRDAGVQVSWG